MIVCLCIRIEPVCIAPISRGKHNGNNALAYGYGDHPLVLCFNPASLTLDSPANLRYAPAMDSSVPVSRFFSGDLPRAHSSPLYSSPNLLLLASPLSIRPPSPSPFTSAPADAVLFLMIPLLFRDALVSAVPCALITLQYHYYPRVLNMFNTYPHPNPDGSPGLICR